MAKKIEITPEIRDQIMQEFEINSTPTIYYALKYETDSPSAKLIRKRAVELGGIQWVTLDEVARELEQDQGTIEIMLGTLKKGVRE